MSSCCDTTTDTATTNSNEKNEKHTPTSANFEPRYVGPPLSELTPTQQSLRASILKSRPHTGLSGPFGPWLAIPAIAEPSQQLGRVVRFETSLSFRESELVILLTGAWFGSETEFDIHAGEARRAGWSEGVICALAGALQRKKKRRADGRPEAPSEFLDQVEEEVLPMLRNEYDEQERGEKLKAGKRKREVEGEQEKNKLDEKEDNDKGPADTLKKRHKREVAIALFTAELLQSSTVSDATYSRTKEELDGKDSMLVEITAIVGYYSYVAFTLNVFRIPSGKTKE